jgi:O-glycosyl hydrolase
MSSWRNSRPPLKAFLLLLSLSAISHSSSARSSSSPTTSTTIVVDRTRPKQILHGFGSSLCWFANVMGAWRNQTLFEEVADLLFHADPSRGLGLRQLRYNVGGGEHPQNAHFLRTGGMVRGYLRRPGGRLDLTADATQRRVLRTALQRGVDRVMAFSNSPPWFMTQSGSVTGAQGGGNNLRDDMYDAFAAYLAQVAASFAAPESGAALLGGPLTFAAVTPLNEPVSPWWKYGNGQEGCHFDRDKQSQIVAQLGKALRAAGAPSNVTVAAPEENSLDDSLASLQQYSSDALAAIGLVTTHSYNGYNRAGLAAFANAHGQALWHSEYGTGSGPLQGGVQLAQRIVADLNALNCTIWTLWQLLDADNSLSPSGWGLLAGTYHEEHLYRIRLGNDTVNSTQCLAAVADGNDGSSLALTVAPCAPFDSEQGQQQIFSVTDAYLHFSNSSGPCADDWGQAMQPGDAIRMGSCWGGANQQWQLGVLDGRIRLNNASGLCLTAGVGQAGKVPGVTVDVCDQDARQGWTLTNLQDDEAAAGNPPPALPGREAYLVRMQYWAFKQFTSYITPGSVILTVDSDPGVTTVAALRPDGRTVLVTVNPQDSDARNTFLLKGWQGQNRTVEVYQTTATAQCARLADISMGGDNTIDANLPAQSVSTFLTW